MTRTDYTYSSALARGYLPLFDGAARLLRLMPPEQAHALVIRGLRAIQRFLPPISADPVSLNTNVWGRHFHNPIGLAAGFDKDAEVWRGMFYFGFGFVEAGTVTPRPQPGSKRPRLFRLRQDKAVINRMGFNSAGLNAFAKRVSKDRYNGCILGANIGKNTDTTEAIDDYVIGVQKLAPLVDYLVINISSPNTPGLRDLQRKSAVVRLVERLKAVRAGVTPENPPPLLLKIAPDLDFGERRQLADAALITGVDGLIVSNTTDARPPTLKSPRARERGGLSGKPLFEPSTKLLSEMYDLTGGRVPLIGVGGIFSGEDAYLKIRAGASLVQILTAFYFQPPSLIGRVKSELASLLARDGFSSVSEAVGTAVSRNMVRRAAR